MSLKWKQCELADWIHAAIEAQGFENMTPVQAATIPLFTGNKDVVVEAVTGSGKTVSFVVPVLQRFVKAEAVKGVFAIVLAPTRELAMQIVKVFEEFLQYAPPGHVRPVVQQLVGSLTSIQEDMQIFKETRADILVGTPGKVLEFLGKIPGQVRMVDCLVLDEADRLLDVSFEMTVREIVNRLPRQKRIGLFSATVSSAGDMIFKIGMANPVKVTVKGKSSEMNAVPKSLTISYKTLASEYAIEAVFHVLANAVYRKAIVYFPTCVGVTYFYAMFNQLLQQAGDRHGIKMYSIHGKLQLKPRIKTLESFGTSAADRAVLLATDVAARGIDIPDVDLVVQLSPSTDPDVFLHRCGRTGRANKVGRAIVFLGEGREEDYVDLMRVKKVDLVEENTIDFQNLPAAVEQEYQWTKPLKQLVHQWVTGDRANNDLGIRSYVGFIKYYSKHTAQSIFRLENLDYVGLARAYGLLRLPKMPEITRYVKEFGNDGWLGDRIDMKTYKYRNGQKEQARLEQLGLEDSKRKEYERKSQNKKINEAWSGKLGVKETRQVRREKNEKKRHAIEKKLMEESSDEEQVQEDWKDAVRQKKKQKVSSIGKFDGL